VSVRVPLGKGDDPMTSSDEVLATATPARGLSQRTSCTCGRGFIGAMSTVGRCA
jgi:hypothetical protein